MDSQVIISSQLKKAFTLQQDQSDCGVACLLSLIQYYQGASTLEHIRNLSGTSPQGTTLLGLYHAAHKLGFEAEGCEADIEALIAHGEPVILHLQLEHNLLHYVVCYGWDGTHFSIGDPGKGIEKYTAQDLEKVWKSKQCLTLKPNDGFVTAVQKKKAQRKWLYALLEADFNLLFMSMLLGLVISGLSMVMAIFSQKLIDDILPTQNVSKLLAGISLVIVLLFFRVLFISLRLYLLNRQGKDFNNRLIGNFYNHLFFLPKSFFDGRKIGDLTARLHDSQRIQRVISQLANSLLLDFLVVVVSIVFLFLYSVPLAIFSLLVLPVLFFLAFSFNQPIAKAQKTLMGVYAQAESKFLDTMGGIEAIKGLNKANTFVEQNKEMYSAFQNKVFDLGKLNVRLNLYVGSTNTLFITSIFGLAAYLVLQKQIKLGEMMAIITIVSTLLPSVLNLAMIMIPIQEAKIAFDRMYEFVEIPKEQNEGIQDLQEVHSLTVKNLSFRFAGRKALFNDFHLELAKGKIVALLGESGVGKSTLIQILMRFYDFDHGNILINHNIRIQDLHLEEWRSKVGIVPQNIKVFNTNLIGNILIGDAVNDAEKVVQFCKDHGFDTYFESLPQSYFTILGENGVHLSGGQTQLLALARALYAEPQVLLLDEFTASMDPITADFAWRVIEKLKSNTAILFITHDQDLAQKADITVRMEGVKSLKIV